MTKRLKRLKCTYMTDRIITATEARNRWFEILNLVYFRGEDIVIEKNDVPIVKIVAFKKPEIEDVNLVIKKTFGFLKNITTYFPSLDKKIRAREIGFMDRLWKQ